MSLYCIFYVSVRRHNKSLLYFRRLVFTSDPQLPKTMVSGTLPSLVLHFSEQKVRKYKY